MPKRSKLPTLKSQKRRTRYVADQRRRYHSEEADKDRVGLALSCGIRRVPETEPAQFTCSWAQLIQFARSCEHVGLEVGKLIPPSLKTESLLV